MGEPIAGRISEEAKEQLELEAEKRGVSISELTGSIVTLWLRDEVLAGSDPDDAREPAGESIEQVRDELEAVRKVLKITAQDAHGVSLAPWVETQVFSERRGESELEEPDYVNWE